LAERNCETSNKIGVCRDRGLSKGDQDAILSELRRLGSQGHLDLHDNVPATAESLAHCGEREVPSSAEVFSRSIWFDTQLLRQAQKSVMLAHVSCVEAIQELLLDKRIDPSQWRWERAPAYEFADGEDVQTQFCQTTHSLYSRSVATSSTATGLRWGRGLDRLALASSRGYCPSGWAGDLLWSVV